MFDIIERVVSTVFAVTLSSHRLLQLEMNQLKSLPAEIGQLTNLPQLYVRCL